MKILIDIGHPAHVHYFRNLINTSKENGYEFVVVARDKEVSQELLRAYEIPFISRGKGASSRLGKFLYMIYANWIVWRIAIKEKPDLFLSVVSPYAAQVSCLVNKPHIALDDTEHATFARKFYLPFSRNVITPVCFTLDLGEKQIRINSFFELFYLHPSRFVINNKTIDDLSFITQQRFAILRFVSWGASHDYGQKGIDMETKLSIINRLNKTHKIVISSEGELPEELEKYRLKIRPEQIHYVINCADMYIGEGATMASEAAMLGTPAIYFNSLEVSTIKKQSDHLLIWACKTNREFNEAFEEILSLENRKEIAQSKLNEYLRDIEDPNSNLAEILKRFENLGSAN